MSKVATTYVETLNHEGRGIAKIAGKTTFIRDALPHEEVEFVYTRRKGQFDEGQVLKILTPSPYRIPPECPHFGICGGCGLQHMSSEMQIIHKQQVLLEQLKHIGSIIPENILPPLTAQTWHYRSKARLGVKYVEGKGKVLVGFRERNGRFIADLSSCKILHQNVGNKIAALSEMIMQLECRSSLPQIEIAVADNATALVFRHLQSLSAQDIQLLITFGQHHHFWIYLQPKDPDSVYQLYPQSNESLYYSLKDHNLKLQFEPLDFTQVNQLLNQKMVNLAVKLLELNSTDIVLDLFCGLGNFSLPIALKSKLVIGIEGHQKTVERAKHNAKINNITNAEFFSANLAEDFNHLPWTKQKYNKILLDPPRIGAIKVIENIVQFNAEKIVYVSCNTATFARDAKILIQHGYKLRQAGIMDMFPHTNHTESIGVFVI